MILLAVASLAVNGGCRRTTAAKGASAAARSHGGTAESPTGADAAAAVPIVFPESLRVADDTVNEFVVQVLRTCVSGDYDAFRLLWSARDEPFRRDRYERAWRTVRTDKVKLLELQPMRNKRDGQLVYYVHATVGLDESVRQPEREIVLMVVREEDAWRLTRAPESVRRKALANSNAAQEPE